MTTLSDAGVRDFAAKFKGRALRPGETAASAVASASSRPLQTRRIPPRGSASLSWSQRLSSLAATPIRRLISRRGRPPESSLARTTILTIPSATHRTTPGIAAVAANRRRSSRSWPLKRRGPLAGRNRPKKTGSPAPRASCRCAR